MKTGESKLDAQQEQLDIPVVRQRALDWWSKLPMFNMDKTCKRILAARHYKKPILSALN